MNGIDWIEFLEENATYCIWLKRLLISGYCYNSLIFDTAKNFRLVFVIYTSLRFRYMINNQKLVGQ